MSYDGPIYPGLRFVYRRSDGSKIKGVVDRMERRVKWEGNRGTGCSEDDFRANATALTPDADGVLRELEIPPVDTASEEPPDANR